MTHITFIHGIANKPEEAKLKRSWLNAIASNYLGNNDGIDLESYGVTTSMIYWADVLYEKPDEYFNEKTTGFESMETTAELVESDPDMSWRIYTKGSEKEFTDKLASKLSFDILVNDDFVPKSEETNKSLERIPLPWFIKRRMMKWLLRDVHHYLFNYEYSPHEGIKYKVMDEIRSRVIRKLNEVVSDNHIVISHSMGTVIMYDCLKRVNSCPSINGFITIGSPLGIDEIQDQLAPEWTKSNGFPEKVKNNWVNIYDYLDPVTGFDGNVANDFKRTDMEVIEIINEQNWGSWRHNITNYLSEPKFRAKLKELLKL